MDLATCRVPESESIRTGSTQTATAWLRLLGNVRICVSVEGRHPKEAPFLPTAFRALGQELVNRVLVAGVAPVLGDLAVLDVQNMSLPVLQRLPLPLPPSDH